MKAIDFFCGAGGLTKGLTKAGIEVLAGLDLDALCQESYENNNANSQFIATDIHDVKLSDLQKYAQTDDFSNMLFAGCAPCQPFSQQRKTEPNQYEATLLLPFGRLIEAALPGYVLMENVPGIMRVKGNSTFKRFLTILRNNGYHFVYGVVDAKYFGVPQTRRRLVLLASRYGELAMPSYTHDGKTVQIKTVKDAIKHFPAIMAGESSNEVPNHAAASISERNLTRLRNTPPDGGDRRSWPRHLWLKCHSGDYAGHTDVYGRMYWDQPAPTLTARCHSISNGRYGHPEQNRAISLREAAALQSFPDTYIFKGKNTHIARQIGNAVPPALGEILGRYLLDQQRITQV